MPLLIPVLCNQTRSLSFNSLTLRRSLLIWWRRLARWAFWIFRLRFNMIQTNPLLINYLCILPKKKMRKKLFFGHKRKAKLLSIDALNLKFYCFACYNMKNLWEMKKRRAETTVAVHLETGQKREQRRHSKYAMKCLLSVPTRKPHVHHLRITTHAVDFQILLKLL